jgi:hypothetical protein
MLSDRNRLSILVVAYGVNLSVDTTGMITVVTLYKCIFIILVYYVKASGVFQGLHCCAELIG